MSAAPEFQTCPACGALFADYCGRCAGKAPGALPQAGDLFTPSRVPAAAFRETCEACGTCPAPWPVPIGGGEQARTR